MRSIAMEQRPDGSVSIFDINRGLQYKREPGSDGRWLKRTISGWREVSERRARRLERASRHRDTTKAICRFPRLRPEDMAAEAKAKRLASLTERSGCVRIRPDLFPDD